VSTTAQSVGLNSFERNLHLKIYQYPATIDEAASTYNPAVLANYIFELVKEFSSFYQNVSILNADEQALIDYRIQLVSVVARIVKSGMNLLGIQVPERM
jgi:arginyl-tRNA synthetase